MCGVVCSAAPIVSIVCGECKPYVLLACLKQNLLCTVYTRLVDT